MAQRLERGETWAWLSCRSGTCEHGDVRRASVCIGPNKLRVPG
jgi:hypothetical protein